MAYNESEAIRMQKELQDVLVDEFKKKKDEYDEKKKEFGSKGNISLERAATKDLKKTVNAFDSEWKKIEKMPLQKIFDNKDKLLREMQNKFKGDIVLKRKTTNVTIVALFAVFLFILFNASLRMNPLAIFSLFVVFFVIAYVVIRPRLIAQVR